MKRKKIYLLLVVAAMLAACEPENVVTPEPEPTPSGPTYLTSFTGTMWNHHDDYWLTAGGMDFHILRDIYWSFLTDSTGTRRTYCPGSENVPEGDYTFGFYYVYDTLTHVGMIEDSGAGQYIEFLYDIEQDVLITPADTSTGDYAIYTRVQ